MSLPYAIREAQKKFLSAMKVLYDDEIVMVRVDTEKLRFIAFHKEDQGPKWIPCEEYEPIPHDILSRDVGGGERPRCRLRRRPSPRFPWSRGPLRLGGQNAPRGRRQVPCPSEAF